MPSNLKTDRLLKMLAILILLAGAVLRISIYLQNRNLIIDEANVARNIYERGFAELLQPLSYEQYAPPVFLWITKVDSILFGMGELSLRLYPIICGLLALILMYRVLRHLMPLQAIWYPLILFACAPIMVRYSSELKQYMPDVFISLLLLWLALRTDIREKRPGRFALLWIIVGSVAVWSSMPSVFLLAGVGCYYGWTCFSEKDYKKLLQVTGISIVWVAQFAVYYFSILEPQANSEYLQKFHHYEFLFATPSKLEEWQHNWYVFSALMRQFEGLYPYVHDINTGFLLVAVVMLVRKAKARAFLLIVPVLGVCAAAAVDKYSLMPRVALFIIPVLMILIGYGFSWFAYLKSVPLKVLLLVMTLYAAGCNIAELRKEPFKYEELTEGLAFLQEHELPGVAITVYHASVPAFIYYTTMHPQQDKWADIKNADRMSWYHNYDSLGWQMRHVWSSRRPLGFVYTNTTKAEFDKRNNGIKKHMQELYRLDKPYIKAYIYIKPEEEEDTTEGN